MIYGAIPQWIGLGHVGGVKHFVVFHVVIRVRPLLLR